MSDFIAHHRESDQNEQSVYEHLRETSLICRKLAEKIYPVDGRTRDFCGQIWCLAGIFTVLSRRVVLWQSRYLGLMTGPVQNIQRHCRYHLSCDN